MRVTPVNAIGSWLSAARRRCTTLPPGCCAAMPRSLLARPPHGPHRRPAGQEDLAGHFEAVPNVELLILLARGLEIGRHAVPIARLEHRGHERRPEPPPLPSRPRAE